MSVVSLNSVKTTLQSTLASENTTTASPLDLSEGLEERVKEVMTINPQFIPIGGERLPAVTIWLDQKDIELNTIALNQLNAKRKATYSFKVAGIVFRSFVSDYRTDEADDEAAILMENVEEVLRGNPNLSGNALWHKPTGVTYHNIQFSEESAMRAGIMDIEVLVNY